MKLFIASIHTAFLAFVIFCSTSHSFAQNSKVLWEQEFGDDEGLSYSPGAVTFDATDNKLLILGTSYRPRVYSDGKYLLWEIDQDGNITKDIVLSTTARSNCFHSEKLRFLY